eukprot:CAMPEP_0172534196 /NCGR_PEP_ID=MMETSP1067-20121228/6645_1 /TAXON_ID=265564 ORGANISM="Thalassiosira punctigera, Strain Tpunct2005C2" /NCGR_SAMPLE_ID=MMETSP1067 /ASSEMBLY_ACC=CAM_ASM_000444 /LENGTH=703 /DNA_ID=CAMNT_0013318959 /DNA_START=140 /DNA_END=2251 /DNA_ORIENTATION=+
MPPAPQDMNGSGSNGRGPDKEMIALMQKILSSKPLSCDDVVSLEDARKELRRIRKLMDNFKKNDGSAVADEVRGGHGSGDAPLSSSAKGPRNAIHNQERIDDYVKEVVPKSPAIRLMILNAIKSNVLFESNTEDELTEIIDVFEPCTFDADQAVIRQGERGDDFYVVETGELSITVKIAQEEDDMNTIDGSVNEVKVGNYQDGSAFGELALIYGSPRAATIVATESCKLWKIKRGWYRGVVGQHRQRLHKEKVEFLPKVKVGSRFFRDVLERDQLDTMAQLLKQEYFRKGDAILREGEAGNTFYIIQSGEVEIYRKQLGPKPIATLGKEKFFGEKALLSDDVRQATVVAKSPIVVCYVMTRGDFTRVLGNLQDILDNKVAKKTRRSSFSIPKVTYKLEDLETLNVLGQGAFGKVKMVKAKDTGKFYALKAQGKAFIIDNGQKIYVINEMKLMTKLQHPNILVMHCAMQDPKYIYFLLELLPGGELMNLLEKKRGFAEEWVKFYSASVILAYTEFHAKRVAYRDLKPENLVLNAKGYCVVVDMGLAKQLEDGPTYTFCGTPDYIAPELIRGTGYNWAVDYWALGVLLYELHSGSAPFQSYDPTGTAKKILKGSVNFPSKFSSQMRQVIKALLMKDPTRRLGCMNDGTEGVMKHRFYHGFDWQGLLDMKIDVPYKPKLPSNMAKLGRKDDGRDNAKATNWNPDLE